MSGHVTADQRHAPRRPCPICDGHDQLRRGQGIRCAGFTTGDGACAFCTREEYAGLLRAHPGTQPPAYCHRLHGPCDCGATHAVDATAPRSRPLDVEATYDYRDADGKLRYQVVRARTKGSTEPKRFYVRRPGPEPGSWINGLGEEPRILYRLPELLEDAARRPVHIPEGEKDVDRLVSLGLSATTNPFGARAWRQEFVRHLHGLDVVVLLDDDADGLAHGEMVARSLYGRARSVKVVLLPGLPPNGDVSDWLQDGHTVDELQAIVEAAEPWEPSTGGSIESDAANVRVAPSFGRHQSASEARTPPGNAAHVAPHWARPDATTWPILDPTALHGLAGDVVRAIEPHTEADPAALFIQFLVGFGNLVGPGPHFVVEADVHPAVLFATVVGDTAKARKGTAWGHVRRILRSVEEEWESRRVQSGLSSGEGLIYAVRDPLGDDLGVEDRRLMILESELASTLRVIERQGNTLSPVVRQAWDTGNLRTLTKGNPVSATGSHISIVGHVTAIEVRRYLYRTEMANGFANRFLWACARRARCLPEGGKLHEEDLGSFVRRIHEAVRTARSLGRVHFDDAALELWRDVYPSLSEGRPGMFGAITARAEAQVIRLGLIYALLDSSGTIARSHLEAALALWRYCEDSARYVFGDSLGDPLADQILEALRAAGPAGLTQTMISGLFGRNRAADVIDHTRRTLSGLGLARFTVEETGGRPATRWVAVEGDTKETK